MFACLGTHFLSAHAPSNTPHTVYAVALPLRMSILRLLNQFGTTLSYPTSMYTDPPPLISLPARLYNQSVKMTSPLLIQRRPINHAPIPARHKLLRQMRAVMKRQLAPPINRIDPGLRIFL
jgi:hypothetical protein